MQQHRRQAEQKIREQHARGIRRQHAARRGIVAPLHAAERPARGDVSAAERQPQKQQPVAAAVAIEGKGRAARPAVAAELRLPREAGYDDLLLALLEHRAEQLGIGRFRWYTPAQLQAVIAESTALPEEPRRPLLRSRPLEAAEILAAALPLLG